MFWPNCRAEGSNRTGLFRDTPKTAQNHGFGLKTMVFGVKTMVSGVGVFGPPPGPLFGVSRRDRKDPSGMVEKPPSGWSNFDPSGSTFLSAPKGSKR